MDKHIFTNAIDNVYKFTGYGGGLGHPMVKRSDLFKWDQIMVDEFLDKFTNNTSDSPNLSYLWFYSTHYNYYASSDVYNIHINFTTNFFEYTFFLLFFSID